MSRERTTVSLECDEQCFPRWPSLWTELGPQPPAPHNVPVLGDGAFTEVLEEARRGPKGGALIQRDRCPREEEETPGTRTHRGKICGGPG